jgi:hypothetical protein
MLKVIVPNKMKPVVDRMNELIERANSGDKYAEKVLNFAKMYGSGPKKMKKTEKR